MDTFRKIVDLLWNAARSQRLLARQVARPAPSPRPAEPPLHVAESHDAKSADGLIDPKPAPIMPESVVAGGRRVELPSPSIWPAVLAIGATVTMFGLITNIVLVAAGVFLVLWALAGWIGEVNHEQPKS